MFPMTGPMLNARREKDCIAITVDRKYYETDGSFVKRSLRPSEWQINPVTGTVCVPRSNNERLLNEAACLQFIAENTDIPVPKLFSCFEDDNSVYVITEFIEGVAMSKLSKEKRQVIEHELEGHLETLSNLNSDTWGGPTGLVMPPYRVMMKAYHPMWKMKRRESKDLVFCHNDLSTHNVIVDPETLKIKATLDWEYSGFFLPEFEGEFFRRPGPSVALDGEVNDDQTLLDIMRNNRDL